MGRLYERLDETLIEWIGRQPMFFVATAPNDPNGHVNLSPKGGIGALRVLGPTTIAYLDLIGSGIETVAHLRENGRIVVMLCSFEGAPKIVRIHGHGRVVPRDTPEFSGLLPRFDANPGMHHTMRSIVVVEATRISDSCGFVVPRMSLVEERSNLFKWAENREETYGPDWKNLYQQANNLTSIDGLPGYPDAGHTEGADLTRLSSAGRAL